MVEGVGVVGAELGLLQPPASPRTAAGPGRAPPRPCRPARDCSVRSASWVIVRAQHCCRRPGSAPGGAGPALLRPGPVVDPDDPVQLRLGPSGPGPACRLSLPAARSQQRVGAWCPCSAPCPPTAPDPRLALARRSSARKSSRTKSAMASAYFRLCCSYSSGRSAAAPDRLVPLL